MRSPTPSVRGRALLASALQSPNPSLASWSFLRARVSPLLRSLRVCYHSPCMHVYQQILVHTSSSCLVHIVLMFVSFFVYSLFCLFVFFFFSLFGFSTFYIFSVNFPFFVGINLDQLSVINDNSSFEQSLRSCPRGRWTTLH